jgi:hypothetical protein
MITKIGKYRVNELVSQFTGYDTIESTLYNLSLVMAKERGCLQ